MRVRMIFSTRYCGLVPWMLCASFTVRFAMAIGTGPPQHGGKHTHPTSERNDDNFRFLFLPPPYSFRAAYHFRYPFQIQIWRHRPATFSRPLRSVRVRGGEGGTAGGLWREILSGGWQELALLPLVLSRAGIAEALW